MTFMKILYFYQCYFLLCQLILCLVTYVPWIAAKMKVLSARECHCVHIWKQLL